MRNLWNRLQSAAARLWARFTGWIKATDVAVLAALGLAVAYAAPVDMSWDHPALRTDGTALPLDQIAETRFYCDGEFAAAFPAPAEAGQLELGLGTHECYATTVDTDGQESDPSNSITVTVLPARPSPPSLDQPVP